MMFRKLISGSTLLRKFSTTKVIDPYKILESQRTDDFKTIKKKYYKLVAEYHPDKNGTEVF